MPVPMMNVREMRMFMGSGFAPMRMSVKFLAVPAEIMFVRMMCIVHVLIRVLPRLMRVYMVVTSVQ